MADQIPVGAIPAEQFTPDNAPSTASSAVPAGAIPADQFQSDQDQYGGPVQQGIAAVEGFGRGLLGPIPAAAELASGITTPEAIRGREAGNPWTSGLFEATGFGTGLLAGTGEARVVGGIGEAAAKAAGLGLEGASTISKIASQGIKTGAEMAALQGSTELSKMITQDPGQSLGTAAINVGLSGILGGAGGAAIGAVSPLFTASMEKIGAPQLIDDAKAQYGFRQSVPEGDVPAAVTGELDTRLQETAAMRQAMGNLRGDALERAMPDPTPENTAAAFGQASNLADSVQKTIDSLGDDPQSRMLQKRLDQFKTEITAEAPAVKPTVTVTPDYDDIPPTTLTAPRPFPQRLAQAREAGARADAENLARANAAGFNPYGSSPVAASPQQIFNATNRFKQQLQEWSEFSRLTPPPIADRAFVGAAKGLGSDFRAALEDPQVWGDAALVQLRVNKAIAASIPAIKEARGQFANKVMDQYTANPAKVQTIIAQSLKGKAGLKTSWLNNYIEKTSDLADTINRIHTDAGLDAPVRMTPTPALNRVLGTKASPGTTLGNWLYDKGLATAVGQGAGTTVGAGLGTLIGHPAVGAVIGERVLSPTLTALAKPLLESATNGSALKGSIDYIANVIKGGRILGDAAQNVFKAGAEIIPKDLMPNAESREKLQKSLDSMSENPQSALNVGKNLNHYLPQHATAAGAIGGAASSYFSALKPTQPQMSPLDKPMNPSKMKQEAYDRALDIAQQPLLTLQHARNGTLTPTDVATLHTLYPQLHAKMVDQLYGEMLKAQNAGTLIPYRTQRGLSLLMGKPLQSTLTQPGMASIMMANAPSGPPPQAPGKQRKVSKSTAETMSRFDKLTATPEQSRVAEHVSGE